MIQNERIHALFILILGTEFGQNSGKEIQKFGRWTASKQLTLKLGFLISRGQSSARTLCGGRVRPELCLQSTEWVQGSSGLILDVELYGFG